MKVRMGFGCRPGNRYWTARNIAAVEARYPGVDLAPYTRALKPKL